MKKSIQNQELLKKIKADSTQKRWTIGIIVLTIIFVIVCAIVGAYAVPLPFLKVVPAPVCPPSINFYNGFCEFINFSNGLYWRSYMTNLNKTNVFINLSGRFRVASTVNNTEGKLNRFQFRSQLFN